MHAFFCEGRKREERTNTHRQLGRKRDERTNTQGGKRGHTHTLTNGKLFSKVG